MQTAEMENKEEETKIEFKYSTRKQYERELVRLTKSGDDEAYELLAEEYVRFCDAETDE